jgi:F0F1-type ATP synthase assembly protein I
MRFERDADKPAKRRQARRQALAYQGAFESVFAIAIGAGFGFFADKSFETSPWGVLVGVLFGFGAFILRLFRLAKQLEEIASEESSEGS